MNSLIADIYGRQGDPGSPGWCLPGVASGRPYPISVRREVDVNPVAVGRIGRVGATLASTATDTLTATDHTIATTFITTPTCTGCGRRKRTPLHGSGIEGRGPRHSKVSLASISSSTISPVFAKP